MKVSFVIQEVSFNERLLIKDLLPFTVVIAIAFGIGGKLTMIVVNFLVWFYGVLF